jgi:hypothetical protein
MSTRLTDKEKARHDARRLKLLNEHAGKEIGTFRSGIYAARHLLHHRDFREFPDLIPPHILKLKPLIVELSKVLT